VTITQIASVLPKIPHSCGIKKSRSGKNYDSLCGDSGLKSCKGVMGLSFFHRLLSFPRSAWERNALTLCVAILDAERLLSPFPRGALERESNNKSQINQQTLVEAIQASFSG